MRAVVILLSIAIIVLLVLLLNLRRQHTAALERNQMHENAVERLHQTVEALQQNDIQRLIEHVRKVMTAEILIEDHSNALWIYSFIRDSYPTMERVELNLEILEIVLDGDVGEIKASYFIRYLDSSGRTLMAGHVTPDLPAIWILERQGADWVIVEINEPP